MVEKHHFIVLLYLWIAENPDRTAVTFKFRLGVNTISDKNL
nr:MAG TPA: hypothetical protein [Caudoviricetes sp.]